LRVKDVVYGSILPRERGTPRLRTNFGEHDEVRICGTVLNTFINDEETYGNLVIDDGSASIVAKFWRGDVNRVKESTVGDILDIIASVGEYNNEIYVQPSSMFRADLHAWIYFQLDVASEIRRLEKQGLWKSVEERSDEEDISSFQQYDDSSVQHERPTSAASTEEDLDSYEEDTVVFDDDEITRTVLDVLGDDGSTKDEIVEKTELDDIDVMLALRELMESGDIFEVDGTYKKL
jgi:hypothetical protein